MQQLDTPLLRSLREQTGGGAELYRAAIVGELPEAELVLEVAAALGLRALEQREAPSPLRPRLPPPLEHAANTSGPMPGFAGAGPPCSRPAASTSPSGPHLLPPPPWATGAAVGMKRSLSELLGQPQQQLQQAQQQAQDAASTLPPLSPQTATQRTIAGLRSSRQRTPLAFGTTSPPTCPPSATGLARAGSAPAAKPGRPPLPVRRSASVAVPLTLPRARSAAALAPQPQAALQPASHLPVAVPLPLAWTKLQPAYTAATADAEHFAAVRPLAAGLHEAGAAAFVRLHPAAGSPVWRQSSLSCPPDATAGQLAAAVAQGLAEQHPGLAPSSLAVRLRLQQPPADGSSGREVGDSESIRQGRGHFIGCKWSCSRGSCWPGLWQVVWCCQKGSCIPSPSSHFH